MEGRERKKKAGATESDYREGERCVSAEERLQVTSMSVRTFHSSASLCVSVTSDHLLSPSTSCHFNETRTNDVSVRNTGPSKGRGYGTSWRRRGVLEETGRPGEEDNQIRIRL